MMPRDLTFGYKKLYFLRVRRACQVLKNDGGDSFCQSLFGTEAYTKLCLPEDFRLYLRSEKLRIMCVMWCLLSKYKFEEAARLLVHSLHTFPMAASWIWRVAFHIFSCLDAPENFRKFNNVLDQARLADENNRVLERILHLMAQGDLVAAHKCRSHKLTRRDRYTSVESTITREPEFERVQRLQRLYEGLSLYCLWVEQLKSIKASGSNDPEQTAVDEMAEKAFHRLQEVEAMISSGYVCDVFIRPLIEILEYFGESAQARSLLVRYKRQLPENPNTVRYLCEWYKQHTTSDRLSDPSDPQSMDATVEESNLSEQKRSSLSKAERRILTLRIRFSRHVLPEPAPDPPSSEDSLSLADEKKYLRATHPHLSTIVACLKHDRNKDALDLSFALLDHPSWAVYTEPWKQLKRSICAVGKRSPEVYEAVHMRRRIWSRMYFSQLLTLPSAAKFARKLFAKITVPISSSNLNNADPTLLGPLLTVEPTYVRHVEMTDTSEVDTSQ